VSYKSTFQNTLGSASQLLYYEVAIDRSSRIALSVYWHFLREADNWRGSQNVKHIRLRFKAENLNHLKKIRRYLDSTEKKEIPGVLDIHLLDSISSCCSVYTSDTTRLDHSTSIYRRIAELCIGEVSGIVTAQEKSFTMRPFSLSYFIFFVIFLSAVLLLAWNMTASYPPEYSGLRVQRIISLLFVFGQQQIGLQTYTWARKTVKEEQTVSRDRLSLAAFTLYATSAFVIAWYVYCSYLLLAIFLLVWLPVFNFFPIYTLLRRKIVPRRWLLLTGLTSFTCFLALMWFLSQNRFQVMDLPLASIGLSVS